MSVARRLARALCFFTPHEPLRDIGNMVQFPPPEMILDQSDYDYTNRLIICYVVTCILFTRYSSSTDSFTHPFIHSLLSFTHCLTLSFTHLSFSPTIAHHHHLTPPPETRVTHRNTFLSIPATTMLYLLMMMVIVVV